MNPNLDFHIQKDVEKILSIESIPTMLNVICQSTGMKFAAVARVTDKHWVTCVSQDEINFGLKPGDELELETTICNEIRQHHEPVVIDHVSKNVDYCEHHTPAKYGFESYISFPIYKKNGDFFGTLCAIDPQPAKLDNPHIRQLFQLYTELISFHIEAVEELKDINEELLEAKKVGKLRDTFVAILGHDLRNPLGTTRMCSDILMQMDLPEFARKQVGTIKSTSLRMQELIDNLLDFAKGELGEGIQLNLISDNAQLKSEISQIIKEVETTDTQHQITLSFALKNAIKCDINRIGQMFSNLLSNAVKHGYEKKPIFVNVKNENDKFCLEVHNSSDDIPSKMMKDLFKPFITSHSENNKDGLGLGLYIASQIAKAHNGDLKVSSSNNKTSFRFEMPINS
ncbi:GAF domain-containing sensor histidine kinase [Christiangramia sediminis]|uniref:histidine kinase n=1 Tax=Christiangramia sediminis TaxID=2881336 RepID=A0A9X1LGE8_9FLAO|nr:GAF domain-containing sensor histidine kinase [Christiangramia sediminis]MCB7479817.1 GAF domain-containing sensor histidine kinase [Christiangramia sediminis]